MLFLTDFFFPLVFFIYIWGVFCNDFVFVFLFSAGRVDRQVVFISFGYFFLIDL